jgi:PDZ domain-containing secreted protein
MNDFPASVALGAMSFFLLPAETSLKNSQTSSPLNHKEQMKKMSQKVKLVFNSTTGGSPQYTSLRTLPSYKSQEISQLSI